MVKIQLSSKYYNKFLSVVKKNTFQDTSQNSSWGQKAWYTHTDKIAKNNGFDMFVYGNEIWAISQPHR